uniref:Uncharacterized protein n=1 Tax=Oryza punctata TaxID=4537 RepID=A0A0E0K137_ORYPU
MTGEAGGEGSDGGGKVGADSAAAVLGRSSTAVKEVDPVAAAMTTMTTGLLQPPPLYRLVTVAWASAGGCHGECAGCDGEGRQLQFDCLNCRSGLEHGDTGRDMFVLTAVGLLHVHGHVEK